MSTSADVAEPEPDGPSSSRPIDTAPESETHAERDVGGAIWGLALVATLAAMLSRALAPSLLGVWEGADHIIAAVTLAGAVSSQTVAVGSALMVLVLVLGAVRSSLPHYLRAFSVGVGMLVMLALCISAIDITLPPKSRLVVAGSAALLVFIAAWLSSRLYTLRAASLALAAVAAAGVFRIITVLVAGHALDTASIEWGIGARVVGTLHWVLDLVAMAVAIAIVVSQPRRGRRLRTRRWTVLGLLVVIPLFFLLGVQLASDPERGGVVLLVSNIAHHNRILPVPYVPSMLLTYVEVLRWGAAVALLSINPRSRAMAGALALVLFSRSTLEVPLCSAAVVIAALAVALHPSQLPPEARAPRKAAR